MKEAGTLARKASATQTAAVHVKNEPAFVLAAYPWKETSLVVQFFTQHRGRVVVTVRGAKRTSGRFRGLINPFVPLLVNFSGTGEVKNLTEARWIGGLAPIHADSLLSAFYVNELMLRMTMREDPMPRLFEAYTEVLSRLASEEGEEMQASLRRFEIELLTVSGWGQSAHAKDLDKDLFWTVRGGELRAFEVLQENETAVSPAAARAVITGEIPACGTLLREVRDVLRRIIGYYVGDRGLKTRRTVALWSDVSPKA